MAPRTSVPILLLTGFLGSGKTTLLAQWLRAPEFAGALAIVNELGEVGIDDRLVETSSDTVLLENGCLCCAGGEDLTATLERLFWDRLHRKIPQFSWVLIETTGIADPAPVLQRLQSHALVSERFHVAGIAATMDARLAPQQFARHPECISQAAHASAILITKCDAASADELCAAQALAAQHAPDATILLSGGDAAAASLLDAIAKGAPQKHADAAQPDSEQAAHSANITSAFAALDGAVDAQTLRTALARLHSRFGPALLRVKGLVAIAPDEHLHVVQMDARGAIELTLAPARADAPEKTGVSVIAQNMTARTLAGFLLAAFADAGPSGAKAQRRSA